MDRCALVELFTPHAERENVLKSKHEMIIIFHVLWNNMRKVLKVFNDVLEGLLEILNITLKLSEVNGVTNVETTGFDVPIIQNSFLDIFEESVKIY